MKPSNKLLVGFYRRFVRVPCSPLLLLSCAVIRHGAHRHAPTAAYGLAAEIRSVDWCGCRGMLPLQRYHGPMVVNDHLHVLDADVDLQAESSSSPATLTPRLERRSSKNHSAPETKTTDHRRKRQLRKAEAERRAAQPLNPRTHLLSRLIYIDSHLVTVAKASGALSVPGPRRNRQPGSCTSGQRK